MLLKNHFRQALSSFVACNSTHCSVLIKIFPGNLTRIIGQNLCDTSKSQKSPNPIVKQHSFVFE